MGELLGKLGIDWRLLIAQLVNFLILFVVLKRLLYRPVLGMLEERRKKIARGLEDAQRAAVSRSDLAQERRELHARADGERAAVLERAADDARALGAQRLAAAEVEARELVARAENDAQQMQSALMADVRREIGDVVLAVARKVTAETISTDEHAKIVNAAIAELENAELAR